MQDTRQNRRNVYGSAPGKWCKEGLSCVLSVLSFTRRKAHNLYSLNSWKIQYSKNWQRCVMFKYRTWPRYLLPCWRSQLASSSQFPHPLTGKGKKAAQTQFNSTSKWSCSRQLSLFLQPTERGGKLNKRIELHLFSALLGIWRWWVGLFQLFPCILNSFKERSSLQ